jgi:hypothetical protein
MSSNSTNHPVHAEAAFKKLAETVRVSLQTFNAIRTIPSTGTISSPLRLAVTELTNAAVCEISFIFIDYFPDGRIRSALLNIQLLIAIPYFWN